MGNTTDSEGDSINADIILSKKCVLYDKFGHCCNMQCTGIGQKMFVKQQLLTSLNVYNITAERIIHLIMDLTFYNYFHETIKKYQPLQYTPSYKAFSHCNNIFKNSKPICSKWLYHISDDQCIDDPAIFIGFIGSKQTGKSSIISTYFSNHFAFDDDIPDFVDDDEFSWTLIFNGQRIIINISQDSMINYIADWIKFDVFVLCFIANDKQSYQEMCIYKEKILDLKRNYNDWAMIIVATKCDIKNEINIDNFIDDKSTIKEAIECNLPYIQTSAHKNENINFLFEQIVHEYWIQTQTKCPQSHIDIDYNAIHPNKDNDDDNTSNIQFDTYLVYNQTKIWSTL